MARTRIHAFDWVLTVPIEGNAQSVQAARRVLMMMMASVYENTLNNYSGPYHSPCKVSSMVRDLAMTRSTVQRAINRLKDAGLIEQIYSASYRINVGK